MKDRIERWKQMEAAGDPQAGEYLREIAGQAQAEGKSEELQQAVAFLMERAERRLAALEHSVADYTLHERMGSLTEVLNLAYIARHYFGKTRQWLYQRLKNQKVNGKPASFTPEEETVFIKALNEIGLKLTSFGLN